MCFIAMYSILNTLSGHTIFNIWKNFTSHTLLLVFKIVESLQCIFKVFTSVSQKWKCGRYNTFMLLFDINLDHQSKFLFKSSSQWSPTKTFADLRMKKIIKIYNNKMKKNSKFFMATIYKFWLKAHATIVLNTGQA